MKDFGRIITAMVTPMKDDGSVDYKKAEELALKLVENGSDGLLLHGTTGESPTLTHEEEYELYKAVKNAVKNRASIIAGTGSNSTETAVKSTKQAEKIGVDGVLIVVPYYNKPSQEGQYQHFKKIAGSTSLPIMIYNIPGRTGVNMLPDTIVRLSELKNIIAVKESAGSLDQASEIRMKTPKDFMIYSGDDSLTLPILSVGGCGVVSVVSNIPKAGVMIKDMVDMYFNGDVAGACEMHIKLLPLFKVCFITTNPTPIKAALKMVGIDVGKPRLPMIDVTDKERAAIKDVLKNLKLV